MVFSLANISNDFKDKLRNGGAQNKLALMWASSLVFLDPSGQLSSLLFPKLPRAPFLRARIYGRAYWHRAGGALPSDGIKSCARETLSCTLAA